jgi:hypothetical protein
MLMKLRSCSHLVATLPREIACLLERCVVLATEKEGEVLLMKTDVKERINLTILDSI